jgi:quinol monooxygenase YgiN
MSLQVLVRVCVQPKKRSAFEQLMRQVQVALPQVPGCEAVRVMYDVADPTRYTLLERWSSRERHAAHLAHLVASGDWARLREHLAEEPVSAYLSELGSEATP